MKEDLYKKYLKNIENNKTAIKKKYVETGYFSYYTKHDIEHIKDSKRIFIDGYNSYFDEYIDTVFEMVSKKIQFKNNSIYLGRIGDRIADRMISIKNGVDIYGYNLTIGSQEIKHIINEHSNYSEIDRGQKPINKEDIKLIPKLLLNIELIVYKGINKENRKVYSFISKNTNGTYNLLEFISIKRHQLGLQSLFINQNNLQKKAHAQTEKCK